MANNTFTNEFESFDGHAWLNAASEGPLPKVSAQSLNESVHWKSLPFKLDDEKFQRTPKELKVSIAKLIGVEARDVILANSASYGIHLLANGLPLQKGDEVLLMQNDFPTDILPWLALSEKGVNVKQLKAKGHVLTSEEVSECITQNTKVLCLPHVHTFSGVTLNVRAIADICHANNVVFVVNISQSAGTMPIDVIAMGADAVVCAGYKWLCGPYGTGFAWMTPELRAQLNINRSYWISAMTNEELQSEEEIQLRDLQSARKYDVFGTANFFNFVPFRSSIDLLLNIGLDKVQAYNQDLIQHFLDHLDQNNYQLLSEVDQEKRSNLVVITHKQGDNNKDIYQRLIAAKIYPALWKGYIRISPHIYNTKEEIDKLLNVLQE